MSQAHSQDGTLEVPIVSEDIRLSETNFKLKKNELNASRSVILSSVCDSTDDIIAISDIPVCTVVQSTYTKQEEVIHPDNKLGEYTPRTPIQPVVEQVNCESIPTCDPVKDTSSDSSPVQAASGQVTDEVVEDPLHPKRADKPLIESNQTDDDQEIEGLTGQINLTRFNKPKGSAYIFVKIKVGESKRSVSAYVCVDTGADVTLCDSTYLISHFGKDALKHVVPMSRPPKLRSATGHNLEILGKVALLLYLGEYELDVQVLVYKGESSIFLLGNDSFYGRLIYDRGISLSFADSSYPPIPILYELDRDKVKAIKQYHVAPRSHALIQVKVTDSPQLTGKEVMISPLNEEDHNSFKEHIEDGCPANFMFDNYVPVRNTVGVIDSQGHSILLVQNDTDDILTINPEVEIAQVNFISADLILKNTNDENQVNYVIDDSVSKDREKQWPISALTGEFKDTIPSNVLIRWETIRSKIKTTNDPHNVNFVHDKEERKHLLDGTGEGFPTPPAAQSIHPEADSDPLDPDAWMSNIEHEHLTDQEWSKLKKVLLSNSEAFAKTKTEIGCCNYFRVNLPLKPGTGYLYNKPRPLPHKHREIAAETISELLAKGVIRPSNSPHATNIVVVKKKTINGVVSHRVCVDLRQVNENSVPNRYPNYLIEDAMSKIQGSFYRSAFDFRDAFHMMVLTEESIPITAFHFNNVLFEYVRVPFGHVCAMNAFCCLMSLLCVGYDPASYYADDLMITTKLNHKLSKDQLFDQHLEHIDGMLKRIVDAGLKLVAHKCQWCYTADRPMEWLGFTMENNLLKPQEAKVAAIKNFPVPSTAKQVISFISTASFYRRFIKSFAKEVQPMYSVANKEPFVWTPEAQKSFEKIKDIMCSDLVLRLPRQGEPFQIYSDASAGAIGVVLCQIDPVDKKSHPCAFGSRKFNDCEMKLSIPCKELLAIVYGLNLWSFYICGNPVQVFSDCRAWTFLKVQSGTSGKISRLALLVSEYDISISYVKGTQNKAADGLSRAYDDGLTKFDDQITARHPALNELGAPELAPGEVLKLGEYLEKCDDYLSTHWPKILKEFESRRPEVDKLPNSKRDPNDPTKSIGSSKKFKNVIHESEYVEQAIQDSAILHIDRIKLRDWTKYPYGEDIYPFLVTKDYISVDTNSTIDTADQISEADDSDYPSEASDDKDILDTTDSSIRTAVYNVRLIAINEPCFSLEAYAELQKQDEFCSNKIDLLKKKDSRVKESGYFMKRNVLMRELQTRDSQYYNVICVPQVLVKPLLESTHRSLVGGHFGSQRYYLNMRRKYYWPRMKDDVIDFQRMCIPCQYNDKFPVKYVSGHVIRPLWPLHVVHCDLVVGLPRALDGSHAILLLYDGFSRFTFGIPLSSEKADYVVNKLMSHFVAAFGVPWALHSDNGRNVDGALIRHLARMLGVIKTSTPPHTPNANPTETMCGAVSMLLRKALNASDQRYWSLCLPFVLNALNSTVHTATGFTPNSLFFGRFQERDLVPLIPFDAESANVNEYFQKMRRFQELSFQIVRSRNERKLLAKKVTWDNHARTHHYKEGDFVLVKNKNPASGPGKKKLRAIYVGPFRVIKAYTSSLIVVPWTENSRLDEYYKNADLFRLMHRGDIKPFHTRQVSVKHCKPFRGKIDNVDVIDPIMLTRFLDALGIDSQDEILSQIDSNPSNPDSAGSSSDPSDPSDPPDPPDPPSSGGSSDGPPPPPPPGGGPPFDDNSNPSDPGNHDPDNNDLSSNSSRDNIDPEFPLDRIQNQMPSARELRRRCRTILDWDESIVDHSERFRLRREMLDREFADIDRIRRSIRRDIERYERLSESTNPSTRTRAQEELTRSIDRMREYQRYRHRLEGLEDLSDSDTDAPEGASARTRVYRHRRIPSFSKFRRFRVKVDNLNLSESNIEDMVKGGETARELSSSDTDSALTNQTGQRSDPPDLGSESDQSNDNPDQSGLADNDLSPILPPPREEAEDSSFDSDQPGPSRNRLKPPSVRTRHPDSVTLDRAHDNVRDWLSTIDLPVSGTNIPNQNQGASNIVPSTPLTTRYGRTIRVPSRYGENVYDQRDDLLERVIAEEQRSRELSAQDPPDDPINGSPEQSSNQDFQTADNSSHQDE